MARDVSDRRARRLHLTDKGRKIVSQSRPAWAKAQRQVVRAVGLEEAAALNAALDRTLEKLREKVR